MTQVNPRTVPIALVLGGAIIIGAALYSYAFGQRVDSFLTILVALVVFGGLIAILLGGYLYYWEREKHYTEWSPNQ